MRSIFPILKYSIWKETDKNSYFRYKCEKVILSSCGRLRPSEARVKRPHEDKITFLLAYRTQFFHTTCAKLDLAHAVLFERAQSGALRTESQKDFLTKPPLSIRIESLSILIRASSYHTPCASSYFRLYPHLLKISHMDNMHMYTHCYTIRLYKNCKSLVESLTSGICFCVKQL